MVYIERIRGWWPASEVLKALAVPGYAKQTLYNVVTLSIWTTNKGTIGPAKVWQNPLNFLAGQTQFGKNND